MKGFSDRFSNFPDYILGITKEIWEDRGIGTLHAYYSNDIIVRSPGSLVIGNANVIGATMATLAEFPDRRLLGEDVIWSGTQKTECYRHIEFCQQPLILVMVYTEKQQERL